MAAQAQIEASSSPNDLPVRAGDVVSGKFRVERLLGEGGMGFVFEAVHMQLDERVALKFLRKEALSQPDIVARFEREARAAVKLKSEHVARVLDVGDHGGVPYFVMEFLEGRDLEERIHQDGPLPIDTAVDLIVQACEGLTEAHARGIVHRDIKPANLFVVRRADGREVVKLLDFGISKAALTGDVASVDLSASKTVSIMGSPYYMSPEQIRSTRDVDHRTDVWSLGVVLFELLTGRTPFAAENFSALLAVVLEQDHPRLGAFREDVPPDLELVMDRCLEKRRDGRYQTAAELAIALLPFTRSRRSRVIAHNAVALTRSSGLDSSLSLPSSIPPPPLHGSDPALMTGSQPSLTRLTDPGVARVSFGSLSSVRPLREFAQTLPGNPPAAPPRDRRGLLVGLVGAGLLLAGALVFVGVRFGGARTPVTAAAAPPAAAAPQAAQLAPSNALDPGPSTPTGIATQAMALTSAVSVAQEPAPSARVNRPVPVGLRPVASARAVTPPKPSAPAAPAPDLDIRRER